MRKKASLELRDFVLLLSEKTRKKYRQTVNESLMNEEIREECDDTSDKPNTHVS